MATRNDSIREFLNGRHYGTLATFNDDGSIHLTPVQYLFEQDHFFVSTAGDRKVRNILAQPQASLLVDSRRKQGAERWVSASGTAEIIHGGRSNRSTEKSPSAI
jgi:PPOX class probable F420-dependent enzyme